MRRPGADRRRQRGLLIALGIPFLSIKFTSPDAQILPEERSARQVDNVLRAEFPRFRDTPIRVVVENGTPETVDQVESRLGATEGVVQVNPPRHWRAARQ